MMRIRRDQPARSREREESERVSSWCLLSCPDDESHPGSCRGQSVGKRRVDHSVADVVANRVRVIADRSAGARVEADDASRFELLLIPLVSAVAKIEPW